MIKKLVKSTLNIATRRSRMKRVSDLIQKGLPKQLEPALNYLVSGNVDTQTSVVAKHAEDRRKEIASQGGKKVPILYSPKPESMGNTSSNDVRPQPGKVLEFTMERIAKTGKNQRWGTALYLIARGFEPPTGIELGSCAGISAIYLSSAPSVKKLITVEGSEALANIARNSLRSCSNVKVVNALFDEALDHELPLLDTGLSFAYIDGHHEKLATIHYFDRLIPFLNDGAVVVFDDISWSYDMQDAWNILSKRIEFAHAVDLGTIGVCITKNKTDIAEAQPLYWDLQFIDGKPSIGDPHGWKE